MLLQTVGNDLPYLFIMLGIVLLAILALVVYVMLAKTFKYQNSIDSEVSTNLFTGIGMICEDILPCGPGLECSTTPGNTQGKCYASIGSACETIYDCVAGAKSCYGICSAELPGGKGSQCSSSATGQCQGLYECLPSVDGGERCLVPNGGACGLDQDCSASSACIGNICIAAPAAARPCTASQKCAGGLTCVLTPNASTGYCQKPSLGNGELGSYCFASTTSELGAPCNDQYICNISVAFGLPYRTGYCALPAQIPYLPCSNLQGCVPISYCGEDRICVYPINPLLCDTGSFSCIDGFTCNGITCLGNSNYPCVVGPNCVSGSCSTPSIYSINTETETPPFPKISNYLSFPDGEYSFAFYSYNNNDETYFIQYPGLNGATGNNTYLYVSPSTPAYVVTVQSPTPAIYTLDVQNIALTMDGKLIITTTVTIISPAAEVFTTVYVLPVPPFSAGNLLEPSYVPRYKFSNSYITAVKQAYYDADLNLLYFLLTVSGLDYVGYTPPSTNESDTVITELFHENVIDYIATFVDNSSSTPVRKENVFYLVQSALNAYNGSTDAKGNGTGNLIYTFPTAPVSIGYTKSYYNTLQTLVLFYIDGTGVHYQVSDSQQYALPGNYATTFISQDSVNKFIAYFVAGTCI